jgi:aminobenzoyl-glutamate utilization protein B
MKEYKSAEYYVKVLKECGFDVEEGVSGIPTAFIASWGEGKPIVGFLGEYDALPGLSQEAACPVKKELVPGAYGQGCGHNNLGAGAMGAALILRDYLKKNGKSGNEIDINE